MATKTYTVLRGHLGDREYVAGDERVAEPAAVAHLVANGVLVEKAAPKTTNKAAPKSKNKAAPKLKSKAS